MRSDTCLILYLGELRQRLSRQCFEKLRPSSVRDTLLSGGVQPNCKLSVEGFGEINLLPNWSVSLEWASHDWFRVVVMRAL